MIILSDILGKLREDMKFTSSGKKNVTSEWNKLVSCYGHLKKTCIWPRNYAMLFLFAASSEDLYKCSKTLECVQNCQWQIFGKSGKYWENFRKLMALNQIKKILVLCQKIFGGVLQLLRNFEMRMKTLGTLNLHWSSLLLVNILHFIK